MRIIQGVLIVCLSITNAILNHFISVRFASVLKRQVFLWFGSLSSEACGARQPVQFCSVDLEKLKKKLQLHNVVRKLAASPPNQPIFCFSSGSVSWGLHLHFTLHIILSPSHHPAFIVVSLYCAPPPPPLPPAPRCCLPAKKLELNSSF